MFEEETRLRNIFGMNLDEAGTNDLLVQIFARLAQVSRSMHSYLHGEILILVIFSKIISIKNFQDEKQLPFWIDFFIKIAIICLHVFSARQRTLRYYLVFGH